MTSPNELNYWFRRKLETELTVLSSFLRLCPNCAPTGFVSTVPQVTLCPNCVPTVPESFQFCAPTVPESFQYCAPTVPSLITIIILLLILRWVSILRSANRRDYRLFSSNKKILSTFQPVRRDYRSWIAPSFVTQQRSVYEESLIMYATQKNSRQTVTLWLYHWW